MAVTCGRLPIHQLGAEAQDGFRLVHVTGAYRFDQAGDGDAVDEGLELRPTLKNVAARENKLGVVERKLRPIGNRDRTGSLPLWHPVGQRQKHQAALWLGV
jgi:hypothetical protein